MRAWLLFGLVLLGSATQAADTIRIGCNRLELVLAPGLSDELVDQAWASGESRSESPAVLELRGCKGQVLDRLTLEGPLARLEPKPLNGTSAPTYLVSVDLTAEAGSYNGPLSFPVQISNEHLARAEATNPEGQREPIRLALTGKAAWKKVSARNADNLIAVSCQLENDQFVTTYRRYSPNGSGWRVLTRSVPGLWESDGEFPEIRKFP